MSILIRYMKNNKRMLYCVCGFCGGAVGALLAESVPDLSRSLIPTIIHTSIWSAISAGLITIGLIAAGEIYNRKPFTAGIYWKGLISGTIAGSIAGFTAQSVYSIQGGPGFFYQVVFRAFCWAIMGALLGWRLSTVVPNLGLKRGLMAGAIGGFVGGIGFLITSSILVEIIGRMFGLGVLGAALGFAIITIEEMFRAARLDVIWAPKEITSVTLGTRPVYIGGGDDHIFMAGLPQHALEIVLNNGKIQCMNRVSGSQSDLKEGSRIQIGKVELVVRTKGREDS